MRTRVKRVLFNFDARNLHGNLCWLLMKEQTLFVVEARGRRGGEPQAQHSVRYDDDDGAPVV